MNETIVAIATAPVNQAISIIRLVGPHAIKIISQIFTGEIKNTNGTSYGFIKHNNKIVDEVVCLFFFGKQSFVGEDTVEINAHGGIVVTSKIMELIISLGARMAEPGEFSRRAFLNGKMSLIKAEAINDLINSRTKLQAQVAANTLSKEATRIIDELKSELLSIIATIETNIDYPEYDDIELLTTNKLIPSLKKLLIKFKKIEKESTNNKIIKEGINIVIMGKPNVGKSSLLNFLLNEDKAIVSNIPGTTRDIVEGQISIKGIPINFKDTAGLRQTDDIIENIGIKKSKEAQESADILINLLEPTSTSISEEINKENVINVYNKSDLKYTKNKINISILNNDIHELMNELNNRISTVDLDNSHIIYNVRQLSLITLAKNFINSSIKSLEKGFTPDVVIVDLQMAWDHITNALGNVNDKDILDEIFSKFCLGK